MLSAERCIALLIGDFNENFTEGIPNPNAILAWFKWTSDDVIAAVTMVVVFLLLFLFLLVLKLLLGMALLRYTRNRYARMKATEHAIATGKAERQPVDIKSKRVGGLRSRRARRGTEALDLHG